MRALLIVLVVLGVLTGPASPADAHAALLGATPAPGSVVGTSPTEVVVTFSEPVRPVAGRVQVLDPAGERISGTPTADGATLRIPVRRADQPLGTYLVSYRVISADSHPVGGAITFSVGAPSAAPTAPGAAGTHRSVTLAMPVTRFLGYAGLTLTAGPALFLALLWPRRRTRRGAIRLVYTGLGLTAAATVAALGVQAPAGTGAALWDVTMSDLGSVLSSPYGMILLTRLGVLALLAGLLPAALQGAASRRRTGTLLALAVAGLTTWPLTGHAAAAPLPAVIVAADVVHMAAMAVWLGGLVTLAGFLLRRTDPRILGVLLPAWSRWAALAVVWLVASGVVQAVVQVGSVGALWQTGYGRLLTAKIAVLAVTLGVAAYARRLVSSLVRRSSLRRVVLIEVLATVAILGLSAVLVQVNPGRDAAVDQAAVRAEGVSQTLTSTLYTLQFNIYPVQVGENNTIHGFVYTPAGAPLPADEWTVTARLLSPGQLTPGPLTPGPLTPGPLTPGQLAPGLEPVSQPMLPLNPRHHALGAITFPLAGTYEITFTIRIGELDRATVRTTVTVPAR